MNKPAKISPILYAQEPTLTAPEFQQLLRASTLAERRPADDLDRLERMLRGANLILTARLDNPTHQLVGIARSITDHAFCCYLSDLAVDQSFQGQGIGRALIEHTRQALGPAISLLLAAAPAAVGFYEAIGMPRLPDAFHYRRQY